MTNPELYKSEHFSESSDSYPANWNDIPGVEKVWGFKGEHLALSNYSSSPVQVNGRTYGNAAYAHQALRFPLPDSYGQVKYVPDGEEAEIDDYTSGGWEGDDIGAMEYVLRIKFDPELNPENAEVLLKTGDRPLVAVGEPGYAINGEMWGVDEDGRGDNVLGRILMEIRRDLEDRALLEDKHESDRLYNGDSDDGNPPVETLPVAS